MTNFKPYIVSAVALVVGLVALVAAISAPKVSAPVDSGQSQSLSGTYNIANVGPTFTTGADFGNLPVTINWAGGKIGAATSTAFWKNTTGQTAYVDYAEMDTDGGAADTYKFFIFSTTTQPRAYYDINATPANNASTTLLLNGYIIPVAGAATSTNSDSSATSGSGGTAIVPNNGYVNFLIQKNGTLTASSTVRGFNVPWRLHYHN